MAIPARAVNQPSGHFPRSLPQQDDALQLLWLTHDTGTIAIIRGQCIGHHDFLSTELSRDTQSEENGEKDGEIAASYLPRASLPVAWRRAEILSTRRRSNRWLAARGKAVCRHAIYWRPVYAYIRKQGRDSESAKDLAQAFFAHLLENDGFKRASEMGDGIRFGVPPSGGRTG